MHGYGEISMFVDSLNSLEYLTRTKKFISIMGFLFLISVVSGFPLVLGKLVQRHLLSSTVLKDRNAMIEPRQALPMLLVGGNKSS